MRAFLVAVLLCLVAAATTTVAVRAQERGQYHLDRSGLESQQGNQKKFTGTELALTDQLPTRGRGFGFKLVRPEGRGASEDQNDYGPCGQYRGTAPAGERLEWTTDDYVLVDVLVLDANGGGVISEHFGVGPDPQGPLFHDWYNDHLRFIVPDEDNKLYRLKLRVPPQRFEGPGTVQLVYNSIGRETQHAVSPARTYFQCIDVILDSPASALSASAAVMTIAMLAALILL